MSKRRIFWENFIIIVIFIAIIELFIEDLSRLFLWNIKIRKGLIILNFIIDTIFTIEFIIRSIISNKEKGWINYFAREKGWVDFLSSIPLLIFNSGPILVGLMMPGSLISLPFLGFFNILKITKILRVMRVLRMLRILKIFKPVTDNNKSFEKIIHLNKVISIAIVTISFILVISPLFPSLFYSKDYNIEQRNKKYIKILQEIYINQKLRNSERVTFLNNLLKEDKNVLIWYNKGNIIINHIGNTDKDIIKKLINKYLYSDYKVINFLNMKLYISLRDIVENDARINLLLETIIISLVISFLLFYKEEEM